MAGIGAAVLGHRTRFAPDQLRAAASEAKIAAEGQFPRPAVERAVAAFHRVDAPAVANGAATDAQGLEQRRQIVGEAQIDAEPGVLGLQFGDRLVLEEARHLDQESGVRGQESGVRSQQEYTGIALLTDS